LNCTDLIVTPLGTWMTTQPRSELPASTV
jgi:hypothetical protein